MRTWSLSVICQKWRWTKNTSILLCLYGYVTLEFRDLGSNQDSADSKSVVLPITLSRIGRWRKVPCAAITPSLKEGVAPYCVQVSWQSDILTICLGLTVSSILRSPAWTRTRNPLINSVTIQGICSAPGGRTQIEQINSLLHCHYARAERLFCKSKAINLIIVSSYKLELL